MLVLIILFACAALAALPEKQIFDLNDKAQLVQMFNDFKQEYKKNYHPLEHLKRYQIFVANLAEINALNKRDTSAIYGITQFTDMSSEEFLAVRTGFLSDPSFIPTQQSRRRLLNASNIPDMKPPKQFDWRDYKAVTSVKDQGDCGSDWAFSAVGTLEGAYALKHGELLEFSPQEFVSCVNNSMGCQGGYVKSALSSLTYMARNLSGMETEQDYPYTSGNGDSGTCKFDKSKGKTAVMWVDTYSLKDEGDEVKLREYLVRSGPFSIVVNAGPLQHYKGGIISETCKDSKPQGLHAVLLVGYGEDKGILYWLVKNSWGIHSGEQGYFRMERTINQMNLNCLDFLNHGAVFPELHDCWESDIHNMSNKRI